MNIRHPMGVLRENKTALSPFNHKKCFLIENEYKTLCGCLTLKSRRLEPILS